MTDCSNVEMRELLPEYLHDALGPASRGRVEAHLAACSPCREELATLRLARAVLSSERTPAFDAAAIVRALPRPSTPHAVPSAASPASSPPMAVVRPSVRRSSTMLRIAAAVTFISLGAISVAVTRAYFGGAPSGGDSAIVALSPDTPAVAAVLPGTAPGTGERAQAGLTLHASWRELDDASLESLMGALDDLEAAPLADPETTPGGRALDGALSGS